MGSIALCTFETGYRGNKYQLYEIKQTKDKTYPYNKKNYPSLTDLEDIPCFALVRENEKKHVAIIVGFTSEFLQYNGAPADCIFDRTTLTVYSSYEENISSNTDKSAIMFAVKLLNSKFKI
ncbi:MAG: hypothetical protein HFJ42_08215 [Clostridia bacterium]|nr:hypothetical protein [Clostridia bacterium]